MSRNDLWPQQARVHKFMLAYQRRNGVPPTMREIADELGLKGVTSAYVTVLALHRKGAVMAQPRGHRTLYTAVSLPERVAV